MTDEEEVRAAWAHVVDEKYAVIIRVLPAYRRGSTFRFTGLSSRWAAAAEFTRERKRQIAPVERGIELVKYEIDRLKSILGREAADLVPPWESLLGREQATLDALKQGMREQP